MTQINIKELEDGLKRYASTYEASRDLGFAAIYEAAKAYADQQWREISLAPRDGVILVTNGNGTWPVTYRGGHDGDGYYEYSDAFPYGNTIKGLTHWQPLPPAPVSEGS